MLGRTEDAGRYHALADEVRDAFGRRYLRPDGSLAGETQTAYVLALHFDLLPESAQAAALTALAQDIEQRGHHLSTGFVGTPYINWVLSDQGHIGLAYALLRQTTWPSWLYPITQGATSLWERWDGWTHNKGFQDASMNSFNHYAYGAIGAWLYAVVGGIDLDPEQPGYKHIVMRPRPDQQMTSAKAELNSMYGLIRSAWNAEPNHFEWQVTIPANTWATLHVPAKAGAAVREGGAPVDQVPGVSLVRREAEAAIYNVAAGNYHFTVG